MRKHPGGAPGESPEGDGNVESIPSIDDLKITMGEEQKLVLQKGESVVVDVPEFVGVRRVRPDPEFKQNPEWGKELAALKQKLGVVNSPLHDGEKFSPGRELLSISRGPAAGRRERIEEFKNKLRFQQDGLIKIQGRLSDLILQNPDISKEELEKETELYEDVFGFADEQRFIADDAIGTISARRDAIKNIRHEYSKDEDLFEAVFERAPKGKIEVWTGPMFLYFRCYEPEDYEYVYSGGWKAGLSAPKKEELVREAKRGLGVRKHSVPRKDLFGSVGAENTSRLATMSAGGPEAELTLAKQIFTHENEHCVNGFFKETWMRDIETWPNFHKAKTLEERKNGIVRFFRSQQKADEVDLQDEILAYLQEGRRSPEELPEFLTKSKAEGGVYALQEDLDPHFLINFLSDSGLIPEEEKPLYEKLIKEVASRKDLGAEFKRLATEGISVFRALRERGYSKDETLALLRTQPLRGWKNLLRRWRGSK